MHSIRTRFLMVTLIAVIGALGIATFISIMSVNNLGRNDADNTLKLMCKTGTMNLETYFNSVENSVETVSTLVQESFQGMKYEDLEKQVERARTLFKKVAYNTNGVLTYYFRIDPELSDTVRGFWYVNLDGKGFEEHEVTDITLYDTEDTSALVWFTVPKATGKGIWLPPYITDNLDEKVISYNVPVYWENRFVGVIGIEIDYDTLVREVENIKLYENGYAFLLDQDFQIIYHPGGDFPEGGGENVAVQQAHRLVEDNHIQYRYRGTDKEATWLPLSNGMRLYVSVPLSEINREWKNLVWRILVATLAIVVVVILALTRFTKEITKPLTDLTNAAKEVDQGNYDIQLEYAKDDEVGLLTRTFKTLAAHTREHYSELSKQAYVDALTGVRNKGAYGDYIQKIQDQLDASGSKVEFAIGVFDCDNLKEINDTFGHDKGDEYLKTASRLICQVFKRSPVFRIGGDEFAVILENADFQNREELLSLFRRAREESRKSAVNRWEQVNVTLGLAVYEGERDSNVIDVARRADQLMYENKRVRKERRGSLS